MAVLVKTLQGLAYASVKVRNSLAVASIKSINGLDASGSSPQAYSDDFNRANAGSLGASWTSNAGQWGIFSNTADCQTLGFANNNSTYNSAITTTTAYQKITLVSLPAIYDTGLIFRFTDASSPFYQVTFNWDGNVYWARLPSVGGSSTTVASAAISRANGDSFGVTLTGTGNSTVVRIWKNQTANTPVSATEWDSGDTTPDVTFTDDPASPVNSGYLGGLYGVTNDALLLDNWFYGDTT